MKTASQVAVKAAGDQPERARVHRAAQAEAPAGPRVEGRRRRGVVAVGAQAQRARITPHDGG